MNVQEIEAIYKLFPKYKKVDREFLILCLKHDFKNLFVENKNGKIIFDFKQNKQKNKEILTHDGIWLKDWIESVNLKNNTSQSYFFHNGIFSFHVYIEFFNMSPQEYHIGIKKVDMPNFSTLTNSSSLKKSVNSIIVKDKLLLSLQKKHKQVLQKI